MRKFKHVSQDALKTCTVAVSSAIPLRTYTEKRGNLIGGCFEEIRSATTGVKIGPILLLKEP